MTAIIALFDPDTGAGTMAADSCWSGAYLSRSNPKIRRIGPALVASAGAMAHLFLDQLLGQTEDHWGPEAVRDLAQRWREWCVGRGHYRLNDEHGCRQYPACFLILTPEGIFEIDDDGEACKHPPETKAAAIGIGAQVCMGAMHALRSSAYSQENSNGRHAVLIAVEAAIELCEGCRGPVQVEVLEPPPPPPEPDAQLGAQLLKLIEANNINRAIKLCNQEISRVGEGPFAAACKALLLQANHSDEGIRLTYTMHEAVEPRAAVASVRDALLGRAR